MKTYRRMNNIKRYPTTNMNRNPVCNAKQSDNDSLEIQELDNSISACLEFFLMYEQNYEYIKSLYPSITRKIMNVVCEECDKLEHTGSCMYDEWPDKTHLDSIVDAIYKKMESLDMDNPELQAEELTGNPLTALEAKYREPLEASAINPIPDYNRLGRPNWYRNLVTSLLYNEMLYRRMRYYNRRYF